MSPSKAGHKKFKALNKKCNNENFADGSKSRKRKKKKRHEHVSKMSISTTIRNQIKKMKKWLWVFLKIKRLPVNWSSKQAARSIINDTICICFWGYRKPKKVWWVQRNERLSGLGVVFGQLSTELELKLESEPDGIESKANKSPGANMRLNKAHPPINKIMPGEKVSTLSHCRQHADGKFSGMWSSWWGLLFGGLTPSPQPT